MLCKHLIQLISLSLPKYHYYIIQWPQTLTFSNTLPKYFFLPILWLSIKRHIFQCRCTTDLFYFPSFIYKSKLHSRIGLNFYNILTSFTKPTISILESVYFTHWSTLVVKIPAPKSLQNFSFSDQSIKLLCAFYKLISCTNCNWERAIFFSWLLNGWQRSMRGWISSY